jgi:hypothetical protein
MLAASFRRACRTFAAWAVVGRRLRMQAALCARKRRMLAPRNADCNELRPRRGEAQRDA